MADDERPPAREPDVALLCGPSPDGDGVAVLRAREGRVEAGVVRQLVEGKPLGAGEIVRLRPREGAPAVCDVEVQARIEPRAPATHGPAQVATDAYRESWERIFGPAAKDNRDPRALN